MRRISRTMLAALLLLGVSPPREANAAPSEEKGILVFSGAAAAQQDPVARATATIEELAAAQGLETTASNDPAVFTTSVLRSYRAWV